MLERDYETTSAGLLVPASKIVLCVDETRPPVRRPSRLAEMAVAIRKAVARPSLRDHRGRLTRINVA